MEPRGQLYLGKTKKVIKDVKKKSGEWRPQESREESRAESDQ